METKSPVSFSTSQMVYSHICATAKNRTIGLKGKLPWDIPEDLKFFHKKTKGKALIMGRKTFESLGKPLSHRLNIVVTRQKKLQAEWYYPGIKSLIVDTAWSAINLKNLLSQTDFFTGLSLVICASLKSAMGFCLQKEVLEKYGKEIFIIGGGEIYTQSLPFVQKIYLTRIHKNYIGDAFYPEIPGDQFQEVDRKDRAGDPSYSFITYERQNPV